MYLSDFGKCSRGMEEKRGFERYSVQPNARRKRELGINCPTTRRGLSFDIN